ncbi:RNA-binding region RNP-1 domain-containing protein [Planoprotostelium fungivorum]|uniref:RNA-binding region RNP-1 domain-containing protein n=1 Tax=Planoprotostelium fungivorum TaxID=1890364 RepID=A0A2P6NQ27_9EUKA|nr:RNA-binding region RNP-1 domain-containing protein [Planoprotostelium fungivorum]
MTDKRETTKHVHTEDTSTHIETAQDESDEALEIQMAELQRSLSSIQHQIEELNQKKRKKATSQDEGNKKVKEEDADSHPTESNAEDEKDKEGSYARYFTKTQEKTNYKQEPPSELPDTVTDQMLREAFQRYGPIYHSLVIRRGTGESKGYGFVRFCTMKEVRHVLDGEDLPSFTDEVTNTRCTVRVKLADPKNVLQIGNLPSSVSDIVIKAELDAFTGVPSLKLEMKNGSEKWKTKGFVTYRHHGSALAALKKLRDGNFLIEGYAINASIAELKQMEGSHRNASNHNTNSNQSDIRTLFVKNVAKSVTEHQLMTLFGSPVHCRYGIEHVVIPSDVSSKERLGHAFIYFVDRKDAEIAKEVNQGRDIEGKRIEIEWCRPKNRGEKGQGRAKHNPQGHTRPEPWGYGYVTAGYGQYYVPGAPYAVQHPYPPSFILVNETPLPIHPPHHQIPPFPPYNAPLVHPPRSQHQYPTPSHSSPGREPNSPVHMAKRYSYGSDKSYHPYIE